MKHGITLALIAALVGLCGPAQAAKTWEDMSWWGNTGATPNPVKDSARSGSWWWPIVPKSNAEDGELWGNRGIVYHIYAEAAAPEPEPAPKAAPAPVEQAPKAAPPMAEPPKAERKAIILNNVLFGFDQSTLTPVGKAEIDKLVGEMKAHPKDTVIVEGHTCSIGESDYNMRLGQRRADSVKAYMLESDVSAARIQTVSYGEDKPAVDNDTPEHRKLNRRCEFKITLGD